MDEKKKEASNAVREALEILNDKIRAASLLGLTVRVTSENFVMAADKPPLQSEIYEQVRY